MTGAGPNSAAFAALLQRVEDAAIDLAVERFGDGARRHADVAHAVRALSDQYLRFGPHDASPEAPHDEPASGRERREPGAGRQRGGGGSSAAASASHLAQLLFFTLADLPKSAFAVAELWGARALPSAREVLRVLDVGAGCGAQSLGVALQLASICGERVVRCEIDAVDADAEALALMSALYGRLPFLDVTLRCEVADLLGRAARGAGGRDRSAIAGLFGRQRYDVIVAGSLFVEVSAERHVALARALLGRLAPSGSLIIVEPALRAASRALHTLRDALLAEGEAYVFAPCTHAQACPALADEREWCHESRHFVGPCNLRLLASASGLRRRQLKWSYLTLRRAAANVSGAPGALRGISDPLRSKGKREVFVCGAQGRVRLTRLDRDRSEVNEALRDIARGMLVQLSDEAAAEQMRISRETRVIVDDPAQVEPTP